MNTWVPKTNIVIITAVFLALSILIYVMCIFFIKSKIGLIESAYSNTASTLALEEESRNLKIIADENYEKIDFVNKYFVERGDEAVFIEDVENLARSMGVKFNITSINPVKPAISEMESREISIKMNIEGSWTNTISFIDKIEKLPFGVSIQNFSLDKPSGKNWDGNIEFVVFN